MSRKKEAKLPIIKLENFKVFTDSEWYGKNKPISTQFLIKKPGKWEQKFFVINEEFRDVFLFNFVKKNQMRWFFMNGLFKINYVVQFQNSHSEF